MSYVEFSVEYLASKIAREVHRQEELWLSWQMQRRFPCIASLVESGQKTVAASFMRALGIHVAIFPDGKRELRINDTVLSTAVYKPWFNGVSLDHNYETYDCN